MAARKNAYAPYSDFAVGAALLTEDGKVYSGSNVECVNYPSGCCAERVALYTAVAAGERKFKTIAVTGWKRDEAGKPCMPCGMCRQALYEFNTELRVITGSPDDIKVFILRDIFPYGFGGYGL
jgi:homotetrameric cytidine deaminase